MVASLFAVQACGPSRPAGVTLTLATTTSTEDSGLFDVLVPAFEAAHPGVRLRVIAVGSGQALELGRRGDADVLLVHAPGAEIDFMEGGHGRDRRPVMYNDFVVVGPPEDPAGIRALTDAALALRTVAESGESFLSRGDDSGTHVREVSLWREAGWSPPPGPPVRLEAGQGMGETLVLAAERRMYTLADRGTFMAMQGRLRLEIMVDGGPDLANPYSVIVVKGTRNVEGADAFAGWLTSPAAVSVIESVEVAGRPLFRAGSPPG
jgi:tungstate transport system substrate-binding protein